MTNVIKFPATHTSETFGGPFDRLEATNGDEGWTLYLISGLTGEYRELGRMADKVAVAALFRHIEGIHRAREEEYQPQLPDSSELCPF